MVKSSLFVHRKRGEQRAALTFNQAAAESCFFEVIDDMAKGNHSHFGENMRNVHFRARTFVLIGIALMGFAAFSYWGLSTQNTDLLVKIEQLEDNVKIG